MQWTILIVAALLPTAVTWAYFVAPGAGDSGVAAVAYAVGKSGQFALPLWWWYLHRGSVRWNWGPARAVLEGLGFGLLVGGAAWWLHHGLLQPSGMYGAAESEIRQRLVSLGLDQQWKFTLLAVFYSALHSLLEEIYWRWFVYGGLRQRIGIAGALILASLAFAAHHVLVLGEYFGYASPSTWLLAGGVAVGGGYWAWLYQRSRSLLGPWLSHALVDTAIFAIGYDLMW